MEKFRDDGSVRVAAETENIHLDRLKAFSRLPEPCEETAVADRPASFLAGSDGVALLEQGFKTERI